MIFFTRILFTHKQKERKEKKREIFFGLQVIFPSFFKMILKRTKK